MQRIIQKTKNDCGVACVAMLIQRYAGHSAETAYRDACEVMFGTEATRITDVAAIRRALRHFGIEIGGRSVGFTPESSLQMGLSFDALITTEQKTNLEWHWMVWDAKERVLLDPLEPPYQRPKVSHYIRILAT